MQTVIDDKNAIFTLINTFHVSPENQRAVVESLERFTLFHARQMKGFIASSVHTSLDRTKVVNYVQWESKGHIETMLTSDVARRHLDEVSALANNIDPVTYEVAFVVSM